MKRTQLGLLVFVSLLFFSASGIADTFYVATPGNGGNNGNPGSQAQPWATIQFAINHASVSAGDTIIVTPGTFAGAFVTKSGTNGSPITIQGQPGAIVNTEGSGFNEDNFEIRASYITIDGFEIHSAGRSGIAVIGEVDDESLGVILRNNFCHNNGTWGIFTGYAKDILIENNETSFSGEEHGIYVSNSSDNPVIRYNIVHDNNASGIQINADPVLDGDGIITNAVIDSNIIYENGTIGGAAINLASVRDSLIVNNLLYDNIAGGIAGWDDDFCNNFPCGGGFTFGTRNNKFYNNTIIMPTNGRAAVSLLYGSINNEFRNNILIHSGTNLSINTDSTSQPGINSNFNLVKSNFSANDGDNFITLAAWQALGAGHDQNSIVFNNNVASLFVNAGASDYHILTGSQARNAGTNVTGVPDDLDGVLRPQGGVFDMGAYEFIEACPGDVTDPTTSITAPAAGPVDGDVQITADADDDCSVVKVEFYLEGVLLGTDTTEPYSFNWDSGSVADGTYTLQTIAYDPSGNTGTSAGVDVTVENPFLFSDDFEDGNQDGWTATKPGWSVLNGDLTGTTAAKIDILSPNGWGGCSECTVEADLQVTANGMVSLLAWYEDKRSMVEIALKESKNVLILKYKSNGVLVNKQKANTTLNPGQAYHVSVTFNNGNFSVEIDGQPLFTIAAGATPDGIVGFRVKAALSPQATGSFEEIFVSP